MAVIKKYKAKVESIVNPSEDIYTVTFSSDINFKYSPGQFLHLALDEYDGVGQWPESRCFSMQSNADEKNIRITYSVKGAFTKLMEMQLKIGTTVWLKLPYGDLFQQMHNKENTVFIAGGTGITPFLSLFTHSSFAAYQKPVLYAGFRNKDMNVYSNELYKTQEINKNFIWHIVYEDSKGRLNIRKILNQVKPKSTFFISGPPLMIAAFKAHLLQERILEKDILTDDWE